MSRREKLASALLVALVLWSLIAFPWLEHVECLRGGPAQLRWLTVAGEAGFAVAYAWIPIELVTIWLRLRVRPHALLLVLYGAFIVACGVTHAMGIGLFWYPLYWISAKIKVIGAAISLTVGYVTRRERGSLVELGEQGAALARERDAARAARDEAERQALEAQKARGDLAQANQALAEINAKLEDARAKEAARAENAENRNIDLQRAMEELKRRDARIAAQDSALRTLSTPIIQALDGVLVAVLVGALDSARAADWRDRLTEQVKLTRSKLVIFDLTGLELVDTEVAGAIIKTANVVSLLGSRCVLTGTQPHVAQTIVDLGIDLSKLPAMASLRDALAMVMGKTT